MALGAVGVCCQKVSEAEALVSGGVSDVLVSNEIVGRNKIERLAALARQARIGVCVDHPDNVRDLSQAAQHFGVVLQVLVEIDAGAGRCGVAPGEEALRLAQTVAASPGLRFAGLQAYHGAAQHLRAYEQRHAAIAGAVQVTQLTRDLLQRHGLECPTIAGAGTGTYGFEAASQVYTELQAGSYVFMDADYAKNRDREGGPVREFEHSLFIWTTVMSRPTAQRAVVDAGLKALSVDSGLPWVAEIQGAMYTGASDEHGKLALSDATRDLALGEKIKLIPGHCDPTVNLHDWYVVVQGDRVEALWPIAGRGPGY
jgi:3-hydroxy-D-aspartate aldolase